MTFSSLWGNLQFTHGNAVINGLSAPLNWHLRKNNTPSTFKNPRYKSVLIHAAKQTLMSELQGSLNKIIPTFKRKYEAFQRSKVLAQQTENAQELINNRNVQSVNWGRVDAGNGNTIQAKDKYGTLVKESLMLYYKAEETHSVTDGERTYETDVVCHIDLSPQVSMNSSKNIVMTQVQGRDYTRKELVSGGDLQFSISGNIVSDEMNVYPAEAVKKFIQIMEYNGILSVNFMMFEPFNVTQVIVKDYSLSQQTYKNVQPYSFNCVAVEPDEEVQIMSDTISVLNKELEVSPTAKWYNLVLENKLTSMATNAVVSAANSAVTTAVGTGLDALTTNI